VTITANLTKVCAECGVEKALHQYYKRDGARDGHRSKCKDCYNAAYGPIVKAWQKANPEKVKAYAKRYKDRLAPAKHDPQVRDAVLAQPYEHGGHRYCTSHARLMPCLPCKRERLH
jgi:hypothetical protein